MCPIDDNGIGIGNIDTVLHNRSRKQYVVIIVREIEHNLFKFFRFHLPVADGNTSIGDILVNHLRDMRQITDTIVDEIDLPIA